MGRPLLKHRHAASAFGYLSKDISIYSFFSTDLNAYYHLSFHRNLIVRRMVRALALLSLVGAATAFVPTAPMKSSRGRGKKLQSYNETLKKNYFLFMHLKWACAAGSPQLCPCISHRELSVLYLHRSDLVRVYSLYLVVLFV